MDLCHLKNSELEKQFQKYEGRAVLRGDIVINDARNYAVFREQGASASHVAASKVLDVISRLPECPGQTSDAVSVYTPVKMTDSPEPLIFRKKIVLRFGRDDREQEEHKMSLN